MKEPNLVISNFRGRYAFLSNFYLCAVKYRGIIHRSVEHAYQAAKPNNYQERLRIRNALSAREAKALGRECHLRKDWEHIKIVVMEDCCLSKFTLNRNLRKKLLATGGFDLVEGNTWGDTFWGVCRGKGQNQLGKILMKIREELG